MFKESNTIELKQEYSKSYLKTVSAFANERDGKIYFGVKDNGEVIGVQNDMDIRLQIENAINDSFSPIPYYSLETQNINDKVIVILSVFKGQSIPYLYKGAAYMRNDTATIIADSFHIREWIKNIDVFDYDSLMARQDNLSFEFLANELKQRLNLQNFNRDTEITLGLFNKENYTNGGVLLADSNNLGIGTDAVKFGKSSSIFIERLRIINKSILSQYKETMNFFDKYYKDYEEITQGERKKRIMIPRDSFREAIANALVHRDYQLNSNIHIEFWDTYVKIISPGGLIEGMTEEKYLNGEVSVLRNKIIANVFLRLGIIENFGTGINRIKQSYAEYEQKPKFIIEDNFITIKLPVINYEKEDKKEIILNKIVEMLEEQDLTRKEIEDVLNLSSSTTKIYLKSLVEQNKIRKIGKGKNTKYSFLLV
ncbi:MAG: putative DNA binding domain-containing protein [Lachnospiraceae bacterium]|jgi:ATP-dependent DNA helicase RecG|nr:putative DNA binding domain-containing protein [Lachnospiraceae bacterium]